MKEQTSCCRVMVVEESPIIRSGLAALLKASNDLEVVGEAADGVRAVDLAWRLMPDVILLDACLPDGQEASTVAVLSEISRVIVLTQVADPDVVLSALRDGAAGYLVHNALTVEALITAIRDTGRNHAHPLSPCATAALIAAAREHRLPRPGNRPVIGGRRFGLSAREIEVMELVVLGHSNSDIAAKLVLAQKSVKNYVNRIYAKLEVHDRATAILRWLDIGPDT